jgi:hypothetical protein
MVRKDRHGFNEVLDQDPLLRRRSGLPDLVDVYGREQRGDCFESLGEFVSFLALGLDLLRFGAYPADLCGQCSVLVSEGVLADLLGVVDIEDLASLYIRRVWRDDDIGDRQLWSDHRALRHSDPKHRPHSNLGHLFLPEADR